MSLAPGIPILLRTAPRDIRAAKSRRLTRPHSPHERAAKFATALLARFTDQAWFWIPQGLVFKKDPPVNHVQYFQQNTQIQIAPRLALTVLAWHGSTNNESDYEPNLPTSRMQVAQERQPFKPFVRSTRIALPDELVNRLIVQGKRIEMKTIQAIGDTRTQSVIPFAQPVQRIVRRSIPAESESSETIRDRSGKRKEFQEKLEPMTYQLSQSASEININQLTDQVIRQIDQRILAQRERLGKV